MKSIRSKKDRKKVDLFFFFIKIEKWDFFIL